jgi:predicted transcriptional regulator
VVIYDLLHHPLSLIIKRQIKMQIKKNEIAEWNKYLSPWGRKAMIAKDAGVSLKTLYNILSTHKAKEATVFKIRKSINSLKSQI